MKRPEEALQIVCVEWFRLQHSGRMLYHIPNALALSVGKKDKKSMGKFFWFLNRLKSLGMMKGFPDLCSPEPIGRHHGLYIEMKIPGSYARLDQRDIHDKLRAKGYVVEVCKTFEEFTKVVNEYFSRDNIGGDECPQE